MGIHFEELPFREYIKDNFESLQKNFWLDSPSFEICVIMDGNPVDIPKYAIGSNRFERQIEICKDCKSE